MLEFDSERRFPARRTPSPASGVVAPVCRAPSAGQVASSPGGRRDDASGDMDRRRLLARRRLSTWRTVSSRRAGGEPGRDRGQRAQRVLLSRCRSCVGGRRSRRCLTALRRRSGRREGVGAGGRLACDRGVARVSRPRRDLHQHARRASAGSGRRDRGRPHDRERVRWVERQRHEAQRRHAQPVEARENGGGIVGRQRGRGRGRTRSAGDGWRRWWLDPDPRRLHGVARHEGNVRARASRSERVLPSRHRGARMPGPIGARRGALLRRVRRIRRARSVEPPVASRLGGGPRHQRAAGTSRRRRSRARWRRPRTRCRGTRARVGSHIDRVNRNGRGRPHDRGPQPRGAVDDGKPRDPARRPGRPLARVRTGSHRRGRDRVAALSVAVQPPHCGGRRAAAHPGQRGDGRRVRRRRLRHRRDATPVLRSRPSPR